MAILPGVSRCTRAVARTLSTTAISAVPGARRPRAAGALAAVVVASAGLAACATTRDSSSSNPSAPPRAVTPREAKVLDRAEQVLVASCMGGRGFRYWVEAQTPAGRQFPYVVDDVSWARRHGYGVDLQRHLDALSRSNPNQRYYASLSPSRQDAALDAIDGSGPDGLEATLPNGIVVRRSAGSCTSQAERGLYGDLPAWYRVSEVTDNLFGVRAGQVVADPAFVAATKRWSICMRDSDEVYADPQAARAAATSGAGSASSERRVAVDEATCARRTGLSSTATRLDRHYARLVGATYASQLAAKRRMQLAALPRAYVVNGHARSRIQAAQRGDLNLNHQPSRGAT